MGVLGVRFSMKGVFTTRNALSRFFILWLGVAPNFPVFFCEFRSAGCWARPPAGLNSQKKAGKLGANPNQRIKKRESAFSRRKVP